MPPSGPTAKPSLFNWSSVVGYDFFISYRRAESTAYAASLARLLRQADFRCFLDDEEAAPGQPLTARLRWALRRSKVLIVLVSPQVGQSVWVPQELALFAATGRDIIPIDFGRSLPPLVAADARFTALTKFDRLWLDEPATATEPAAEILGGVQKNFRHRRANRNLRWLGVAVGLVLAAAAGVAVWQRNEALGQRAEASRQRDTAVAERQRADRERDTAVSERKRAEGEKTRAERNEAEAKRQQAIAVEQRDLAVSRELVERTNNLLTTEPLAALRLALTNANHPATGRLPHVAASLARSLDLSGEISRFPVPGVPRSLAWHEGRRLLAIVTWNHVTLARADGTWVAVPLTGDDQQPLHANAAAFSPDGTELAIAGGDRQTPGFLRVVNLDDPSRLRKASGKGAAPLLAVAYSPDGRFIATGGLDGFLRLWPRQGSVRAVRALQNSAVRALAFAPGGQSVFVAGGAAPKEVADDPSTFATLDLSIRRWSLEGKEQLPPLAGHESTVLSLAVDPERELLASAGRDGLVRLWDFRQPKLGQGLGPPMSGHQGPVGSVAFLPGGQLLSAGEDGALRVWHGNGTLAGGPFAGHRRGVLAAVPISGGTQFASLGADQTVRIWAPWKSARLTPVTGFEPIALTRDGWLAAEAHGVKEQAGKRTQRIPWAIEDPAEILSLGLSNQQRHVGAITLGPEARLHIAPRQGTARAFPITMADTRHCQWAIDDHSGRLLVTNGLGGIEPLAGTPPVRIYQLPEGRELPLPPALRRSVTEVPTCVAFSGDGRFFALAQSGTVQVWSAGTPTLLRTVTAGSEQEIVTSLRFAPGEPVLALAWSSQVPLRGGRSFVKIVDLTTGRAGAPLDAGPGPVRALALSAQHVAAAGGFLGAALDRPDELPVDTDFAIRLWNRAGVPVAPPRPVHQAPVVQLEFQPSGDLRSADSAGNIATLSLRASQPEAAGRVQTYLRATSLHSMFTQIDELRAAGKLAEARHHLQRAQAAFPRNAEVHLRAAQMAALPATAEAGYRRSLELDPFGANSFWAHYQLGRNLLSRGRWPEAEHAFTEAERRAFLVIAEAPLVADFLEFNKTADAARRRMAKIPRGEVLFYRGQARLRLGRNSEARQDFETAESLGFQHADLARAKASVPRAPAR